MVTCVSDMVFRHFFAIITGEKTPDLIQILEKTTKGD